MKEFEDKIVNWADARDIYKHSTVQAQTLKAVSEVGELADAVIKGDQDKIADGIGDVMVCLVNVAFMSGLNLQTCADRAWDDIKCRTGRMVPGGAFVKDA